MSEPSTALATREQIQEQAITIRRPTPIAEMAPDEFQGIVTMATRFVNSKLTKFKTPDEAIFAMAVGDDLGIPRTTSLRAIDIVEGKPFLSADLLVGLVRQRPDCAKFDLVEHDNEHAVYEVQRKGGNVVRYSFSVEDAQRAKLGGWNGKQFNDNANWAKYPGDMCIHRAAARASRGEFSGAGLGLPSMANVYVTDEREDFAPRDVTPARPITAAPVQPLTPPMDAEIVESDDDARARFERELRAASAKPSALIGQIGKRWPDKDNAHRAHLRGVLAEREAAKWSVEPAHDPETGEVIERQPGEEG